MSRSWLVDATTSGRAPPSIEQTTARIVASARTEGDASRTHRKCLTPAAVYVNGARIENLQQAVSLRAGPNPVLVRYDQAGRGYFVLQRDGVGRHACTRTPLAMTWFDDPDGDPLRCPCRKQVCRVVPLHRAARLAGDDGHGPRVRSKLGWTASRCAPRAAAVLRQLKPVPQRGCCRAARRAARRALREGPCFLNPCDWSVVRGIAAVGRLVEDRRAGVLFGRRLVSPDRVADRRSRRAATSCSTWATWLPRRRSV